ncbi:type VI secretion system contractile sheath domain-containing protein [Marinobacterium jannaschii]|uniref:type VI secretion system contractile sheath domain-containing protein n=1 Tax=Marinobacterium jannaschii TaxID=64970 RepID=UPI001FDFF3E0|nr:type VI secretion system contractile sheath large subunit [Marinobacterium jannaschii]
MPMFSKDFQHDLNALDPQQEDYLLSSLVLLSQWDSEILHSPERLKAALNRMIAALDQQLSQQLSAVMQHPEFMALEARWRSLHSLVTLPVNYQRIEVKLLDASWQQLSQDINSANTLRSSTLYNLMGNRELNTLGGHPFGMVVIDHGLSMEMDYDDEWDNLYTVELLGQLGEQVLCPFILSPADEFFGENGADWLSDIRRIEKILEGPDYTGWQRLRQLPSSRYIGLAMPKIRLRKAYHRHRCGFIYNEDGSRHNGLWGSAAFAFASVALREFNRISWFGFMKSRWQEQYQGAVINLPPNAASQSVLKQPQTDVRLFGNLAAFYSTQGFLPLSHSRMTDKFFFYGNNSLWQSDASDAGQVMGQLQTTLMICRIAHYLKVQIRSMIGNFQNAAECELYLSRWMDNYCSNLIDADESTLAKYPFGKGRVRVQEVPGSNGRYSCEVMVQPQYQFDHFCGEVVLSTDLGQAGDQSGRRS